MHRARIEGSEGRSHAVVISAIAINSAVGTCDWSIEAMKQSYTINLMPYEEMKDINRDSSWYT